MIITLQPPTIDSEIISGSPTATRGLGTVLSLGHSSDSDYLIGRTVIRFDALSNGGVPKNRRIISCQLGLYLTTDRASYARSYSFFRLKSDWVESEVTWQRRKIGTNWAVAGVYSAVKETDYERADPIGTRNLTASESAGFKYWDFDTDKIFEMVNGRFVNNGFFGMCNAENLDQYFFRSRQHATEATRPIMIIEVEDAAGGVIIL